LRKEQGQARKEGKVVKKRNGKEWDPYAPLDAPHDASCQINPTSWFGPHDASPTPSMYYILTADHSDRLKEWGCLNDGVIRGGLIWNKFWVVLLKIGHNMSA
jgi:hypothetical protein